MPVSTGGPAVLQICRNGFADIDGQRQQAIAPILAVDAQVTGFPIDVVLRQCNDLRCSQSLPCQREQDGPVSATHGSVRITARDGAPRVLSRDRPRQRRRGGPHRDRRYCMDQRCVDLAAVFGVAKERAQ